MESTVLTVPDISCEHCQRAIEGSLSKLEGVRTVKVDIPGKTVQVHYDNARLNRATLVEVLDDIGYSVAS